MMKFKWTSLLAIILILSMSAFADRGFGRRYQANHDLYPKHNSHPNYHPPRFQYPPYHFYHPDWFYMGLTLPLFAKVLQDQRGWQCLSLIYIPYENRWLSYYGIGATQDEAAFNALYTCGGPEFIQRGCYIPPGYCLR